MLTAMNIRRTLALVVVVAIIGIVVAVSVQLRGRSTAPLTLSRPVAAHIDVALHKARFSGMRDGSPVWGLDADRAEYDKDGNTVSVTGIRLDVEETRDAGPVTLTAENGVYSEQTRNILLKGKVRVQAGNGAVFDAESVEYQAGRSLVRTSDAVSFRQQRLALTARGMEYDVREERCRFTGGVDAVVGR